MKKYAAKNCLIAVFLLMLCAPGLIWAFWGDSLSMDSQENRTLAKWPVFSETSLKKLPAAYEKYYSDHLPFREQLISLYARLNRTLFNTPIVDHVIFGQEGWLYYASREDGDPIACYRGENLFTDEQLRQITVNLRRTRNQLRQAGIEFVLFIAPNKERVYSEYLPADYDAPAEQSAVNQLVNFLRSHTDIRVVYPYEELMQSKADYPDIPLYYMGDTHWNGVGAYIGARALLNELGIATPELTREAVGEATGLFVGDLRRLCHLNDALDEYRSVNDPQRPMCELTSSEDTLLNKGYSENGTGRLFIKNDSFVINMLPYLAPWFSETLSQYNQIYQMDAVDEFQPNVFVQVCVERYLHAQLLDGQLYALPGSR